MNKKSWLLTALLAGTLVSCGGSSDIESSDLSVAMTVDGILMDGAMNELALSGLKRSEAELGYKINYQSVPQASQYESVLDLFAQDHNNVIIVVGYRMWDAMRIQADFRKDQKYVIVDFTEVDTLRENILPIGFKAEQGSFLAGYIAGKTTQTNKVGFIGGMAGAIIDMFDYGFEAGVRYANPQVEVVKQYAETFGDPAKGKSIATLMYQGGVDVIFQAAGGTGLGVIEAARESKVNNPNLWVIGVDTDQSYLAPEAVLVSVLKKVDSAIYSVLSEVKDGTWQGGEPREFGLLDGGIALTQSSFISEELMREVITMEEAIKEESVIVPYDSKGMAQFAREYLGR